MIPSESVPETIEDDPRAALDLLSQCETPLLIGVRHHSPACAAMLPSVLDRFGPDRILLELPPELGGWLTWLGHPELEAPVALAGVRSDGSGLAFYPFADFSPELAAVRWARAQEIPIDPFDLPLFQRRGSVAPEEVSLGDIPDDGGVDRSLLGGLLRYENAPDSESLWDQLVEARAPGADAERIRRAALLYGWTLRFDAVRFGTLPTTDLQREAYMRTRLARAIEGGERVAVVVGSFHASALLPQPLLWSAPKEIGESKVDEEVEVVTSLIPYAYELLDSRSGYPAGIRDPKWQQRVFRVLSGLEESGDIVDELNSCIVDVCSNMRREGHVASVPDAQEAVRLACDLAILRNIPSPGRRELLEAIGSTLSRGELLGRGRVLARALDPVMVGRQRGRLAKGTPRSGLAPHVEALMKELRLPGGGDTSKEEATLRLDPMRSKLDRRRHVALRRLALCGVPYGTLRAGSAAGGAETLTKSWSVSWTPQTEAMIELAGIRGVTLRQAAEGALRADRARLEREEKLTARARLELLEAAAEAGLAQLVSVSFEELMGPFLDEAGLAELIDALALVDGVAGGHVAGLPLEEHDAIVGELEPFTMPRSVRTSEILSRAISALEGLSGSDRLEDARAMLELVQIVGRTADTQDGAGSPLGDGRLLWALDRLAKEGSGLIQGAASVVRVIVGRETSRRISTMMGSWVDAATSDAGHRLLASRLGGALTVAGPLFEADEEFHQGLLDRVETISDGDFLARLPALREGFDVLSPAARGRLLSVLGERLGEVDARGRGLDALLEASPELLADYAAADQAGLHALLHLGLELPAAVDSSIDPRSTKREGDSRRGAEDNQITPKDRWRLILGRERDKLDSSRIRYASALDELYGAGQGEGSADFGGGKETSFPTTREWSEELEALFGKSLREEVLGRAVEQGRTSALTALDPETVTPSVELLEQVLSLKGGLPEAHLGHLRRIVSKVIDELIKELATTVKPALTGLTSPRATTRPTGSLDLRRTIEANLKTLRETNSGEIQLVPERLIFRTRARRSLDHRIILVVDVSGSMEPSVIYSAMMAAILSGLPAVEVNFLTFSTEVIDLSDRVDDPLGLLLEVSVGGGTHIAKALGAARSMLTVPARTIVVLVTDFEEGYGVDGLIGEVRALVETGVTALGLAALDDLGEPRYSKAIAELVVGAGMPVAALTPLELARWVGEQIR